MDHLQPAKPFVPFPFQSSSASQNFWASFQFSAAALTQLYKDAMDSVELLQQQQQQQMQMQQQQQQQHHVPVPQVLSFGSPRHLCHGCNQRLGSGPHLGPVGGGGVFAPGSASSPLFSAVSPQHPLLTSSAASIPSAANNKRTASESRLSNVMSSSPGGGGTLKRSREEDHFADASLLVKRFRRNNNNEHPDFM